MRVTRGGGVGGGGPGRRKGGRWGPESVWEPRHHWFTFGPWGEAWGGVGQGGGQGGGRWGGAPESSVGATRRALVPLLTSLKNLTIGLIWLVTRGEGVGWLVTRRGGVGGVGQGGGQGGADGGFLQKACTGSTF